MSQNIDAGGNIPYFQDVFVGSTGPGNLTGNSISTLASNVTGLLSSTSPGIYSGSGAPGTTINAVTGSLYMNRASGITASTGLYVCTGGTTWVAVL